MKAPSALTVRSSPPLFCRTRPVPVSPVTAPPTVKLPGLARRRFRRRHRLLRCCRPRLPRPVVSPRDDAVGAPHGEYAHERAGRPHPHDKRRSHLTHQNSQCGANFQLLSRSAATRHPRDPSCRGAVEASPQQEILMLIAAGAPVGHVRGGRRHLQRHPVRAAVTDDRLGVRTPRRQKRRRRPRARRCACTSRRRRERR